MNRGETWARLASGTEATLFGVCPLAENTWFAVGPGVMLRTTDAGASWAIQAAGEGRYLTGVQFADGTTGTAVGMQVILHSSDGGSTWTPRPGVSDQEFWKVAFADPLHGMAVGFHGVIWSTNDSGQSWTAQESGTDLDLLGVSLMNGVVTVVGMEGAILSQAADRAP